MKRSFTLILEKQPMTGYIQTRCEPALSQFYSVASVVLDSDPARLAREGLRQQALLLARRHPRLKPYAKKLKPTRQLHVG